MGIDAISAIVVIAVIVALFMIFRAIVLWYWRVNERVELLESINEKLELLVKK